MDTGPLSPQGLAHLKEYKYSSVDKSWVSHYILRHWWNAFVKILPLWLAPNMVTLLGFFCILINVLTLYIWIPDLVGPGPSWTYLSFAFGLFMYQSFDNVDGKQARRTNTSSGLGELFDHGIDSLNCTLASLCETAAMGLGNTSVGAFTALIPCFAMFFSTWETYHTHTLYLGRVNGPTEGLLGAAGVMVIAGFYTPEIWNSPVQEILPFSQFLGKLTFRDLWVPVVLSTCLFAHLPACIYHVVLTRQAAKQPILPVFLEWFPFLVFSGSCAAWLGSSHSHLLNQNQLILFCLTMSFVFGRLTTKIILHHLTRQPFPYWTVMLGPLVGGALLANLPLFGLSPIDPAVELWYLRGYFVFAFVVYMRWATVVIDKICAFLDINCLTIKRRTAMVEMNGDVGSSGRRKLRSDGPANDTRRLD